MEEICRDQQDVTLVTGAEDPVALRGRDTIARIQASIAERVAALSMPTAYLGELATRMAGLRQRQ